MKMSRRAAIACLSSGTYVAAVASAFAAPPVNQKNGVALDGYDPVAYFAARTPTKGQSAFTSSWRDATWHFASAENKAKFDAAPETYAPQYGGHCSMAMAGGKKSSGDPLAWRVHNGKLYLNGSPKVRDNWLMQIDQYVKDADWWWQKSYANL